MTLLVAASAQARFLPLDREALTNRTAIVSKRTSDATDRPSEKTVHNGRFMRLNRDIVTVSYAYSPRKHKRTSQAAVAQSSSRPAPEPEADIPAAQSADILFLYDDRTIAPDHPFSR